MVSPSIRTSAGYEASAVTIVPLVMSVRIGPSWATGVGGQEEMVGDGRGGQRPADRSVQAETPRQGCQRGKPQRRGHAAGHDRDGEGDEALELQASMRPACALAIVPERITTKRSDHAVPPWGL